MERELEETRRLIAAARAGRREAFDILLQRYRGDLEQRVRHDLPHEVPGRLDRSDLVQDALMDAVRGFDRFEPRGRGSFRAWLARIADNRVAMALRDQHRLRRDVAREVAPNPSSFEPATSATSPSQGAVRNDERERLERALSNLPDEQARVVRLVKFEELPLATVAARLEKSENAVKKLLARGLLGLRAELARDQDP